MGKGIIEIAVGPMFSGKTEWLIDKLSKPNSIAIKYAKDSRYQTDAIQSHDGNKIKALNALTSNDILKIASENEFEILGIDEIHFFDPSLRMVIEELKSLGKEIFAVGLDLDYLGKPWAVTDEIIEIADKVNRLVGSCTICKKRIATRTIRLKNFDSNRILIGGKGIYEPRCEQHIEIYSE